MGDFLVEEPYLPWAEVKREEWRGTYIALLSRKAGLYERQGALTRAINCLRKIIQLDPTLEPAYQKLMLLYANRGMRSTALKVFEDCKKALQNELDMGPDEVTTSIYRKILESGQGQIDNVTPAIIRTT
jgi:DNA-binding SARP family transcriptional activator